LGKTLNVQTSECWTREKDRIILRIVQVGGGKRIPSSEERSGYIEGKKKRRERRGRGTKVHPSSPCTNETPPPNESIAPAQRNNGRGSMIIGKGPVKRGNRSRRGLKFKEGFGWSAGEREIIDVWSSKP